MDLMPAKNLAIELMKHHGLIKGLDTDWRFEFMERRTALGLCRYGPKIISLSWIYAKEATEEEVRDTILHEIAHALAGHSAGHGFLWRVKCIQIGANPERCKDVSDFELLKGNIEGTCLDCSKKYHRHKVTKNVREKKFRCPDCFRRGKTYDGVISWNLNGVSLN
jgi:predicted SprT family Zn-dependent metalloprotease